MALCLAATPTFAVMALLTGVLGGGPMDNLCSPGHGSSLNGMVLMYLLMSGFHSSPWLKLISGRRRASADHKVGYGGPCPMRVQRLRADASGADRLGHGTAAERALQPVEPQIDDRSSEQRKCLGHEQAADDRDAQRLTQLRPGAVAYG